jgi:hypothetical protein
MQGRGQQCVVSYVGMWQWQTLKAAAEAKMVVAGDILLYSSSVIIVGCVFA